MWEDGSHGVKRLAGDDVWDGSREHSFNFHHRHEEKEEEKDMHS